MWEQDKIEKPTLGFDQKIFRGLYIYFTRFHLQVLALKLRFKPNTDTLKLKFCAVKDYVKHCWKI